MNKQIKINFILPFKPRRPAGGFRIMYEYANRLSKHGYSVHLTFPIRTQYMKYRLPYAVRYILSKIEGFRTNRWFEFEPAVSMSYAPEIKDKYVPDANIVIATWWSTVLEMGALNSHKGKKINLIQGFENWEGHENLLFTSYDMPDTTNIVVASYLKKLVAEHTNNKIVLIENGIDNERYNIEKLPEKRKPNTIAMNYSLQEIKGSKYGIEALKIVKERIPELQVELFSIYPQPEDLPDWIKFYRDPENLRTIYNRNAIFISNSFTEGFGLVSVESMFCGCALICTDIEGHREYAFDNETALLVKPGNPSDMADKICYLINNNEGRIAMAYRGNRYVQRFSWDNAIKKMERVIEGLIL